MEKPAVIIDSGAKKIKCGFGGEENPKYCFPSLVAKPLYNTKDYFEEPDIFFGKEGLDRREIMEITYSKNQNENWNFFAMKQIWRHIYHDKLKVEPEEQPMLISESPLNTEKNREETMKFFFEDLKVPAFFMCPQSVLSLYSSGKTTGLVIDSGENNTFAEVVYEGRHHNKRV